jgi:hypothetical protein
MVAETRSGAVADPDRPSPAAKEAAAAAGTHLHARAGGARRPAAGRRGPFSTAQLYTALALAHASLAVPMVFACRQTAKAAFGSAADPPEAQHCALLQLHASALATSAAAAFALEGERARVEEQPVNLAWSQQAAT